jgi:predicted amidophosphoribosyltransferase
MATQDGAGLGPIVQLLGEALKLDVARVVSREWRGSARLSGQVARRRMAEDQYRIVCRTGILERKIILVDDNVTTGETMSTIARKLLSSGATEILPVTIDRTISTRLSQRLTEWRPLGCAHRAN